MLARGHAMGHRPAWRSALGAWLLAMGATAGAEGSRVIDFEVLLDGKRIGTHRYEVTPAADGSELVTSRARFDVKLLGLTLYRYRHEARELWRDGCLVELVASTDDNGKLTEVRGASGSGGFRLSAPAPSVARAGCVSAYAYWNAERLLQQRELLNPQTGRFDAVRFESLGEQPLEDSAGGRNGHRHRLLADELRIDLWYDADGRWLQLASAARGDRQLLYRRSSR